MYEALKKYSKDTYVNVSFSVIDVGNPATPLLPPPLSLFLRLSPSVGDTLEKSRESRLHQLRHNVTQDFEWAVSSPLSSLATAGHYAVYVLAFRDAPSSTRRH